MTSRDLYAACVGLSGGFAAQCVVHYLLRPSIGLALCLVTLMICFLLFVALHVTTIVRQHVTTPVGTNSKSANGSAPVIAASVAYSAKRSGSSAPMNAGTNDASSSAAAISSAVSQ
jgi:hypothetical protein